MNGHCLLHDGALMEEKTGEFGPWFSHVIAGVGYCNGKKITPFKTKPLNELRQEVNQKVANSADKPAEKVDWDAISKGKVRHGVVAAVIEHGGLEALKGQLPKIDKVVDYIMTGVMPAVVNNEEV